MSRSRGVKRTVDLTQGNIFSSLIMFALPLLAGQLFQTLYNSVDSAVIGNFESSSALAAVTVSSTIAMIISGFFTGLSAGASALFARLFGAKNYKGLHDAIHTGVTFGTVLGLVLAVLGVIFTPFLLSLVDCPAEVYDQALLYLRVYLIGIFFTSVYNLASGVLRAVGDSRSPFLFLVISSLLNIVLDLLFVALLRWGVFGVAIATVIAQGLSMVLSIIAIMKLDEEFKFRFSHLMVDWKLLGEIVNLGIPAGLQSSLTAISNIFVQRYINSFSYMAVAGIGCAMRVDQFAGMPSMALGLAMTTFIGQNIGAKRYDRAYKSVGIATLAMVVYVVIISIPVYIFAPALVGIFTNEVEVINYGAGMLHVIMPLYTIMGFNFLIAGVLRGYRYSIPSMAGALFGMVVMRQLWLYVSLNYISHSIQNVYWGYPVGWAMSVLPQLLIFLIFARRKYHPKYSVIPEKEVLSA